MGKCAFMDRECTEDCRAWISTDQPLDGQEFGCQRLNRIDEISEALDGIWTVLEAA